MRMGKRFAGIFLAMLLAAQGIASASGIGDEAARLADSAAGETPAALSEAGGAAGSRAALPLSGGAEADAPDSRESILDDLMKQISQQSPSYLFASGAVFDIVRLSRDTFEQVVQSGDALALLQFFAAAYSLFCENPEVVGFPPSMVDVSNDDTDPAYWNADIMPLSNGDTAALCYMSVQDDSVEARIFGIALSDAGDRYYYCMLDKDEDAPSDVMQNKALEGIEKVGEVRGRGFELMNAFVACMES